MQSRQVPALLDHHRASRGDGRKVRGIEDGHAFAQQPDSAVDRGITSIQHLRVSAAR